MARKYMNKSEFARHCGVTPPSIARALSDKRLALSANGFIDANAQKSLAFMRHQIERREKTATGKSRAELYADRVTERRGKVRDLDPVVGEEDAGPEPPAEEEPLDERENVAINHAISEIDYAIEKMKSATALNKARLAEMVKATIRRDFVDQVISQIGTCISDHLITLGDRLSPDLAAVAGSTEASVVRQIKQLIDEDISVALHEMQRVVTEQYEKRLEA